MHDRLLDIENESSLPSSTCIVIDGAVKRFVVAMRNARMYLCPVTGNHCGCIDARILMRLREGLYRDEELPVDL